VNSSVHGQCRVESFKSEVDHQIQSVLDVFCLLFLPFERERTEPERRVRGRE
jgi:flagellar biosynthesis/type III secretory pathway protein FliH